MEYLKALGTFLAIAILTLAIVALVKTFGFDIEGYGFSAQTIWNGITVFLLIRSFQKP